MHLRERKKRKDAGLGFRSRDSQARFSIPVGSAVAWGADGKEKWIEMGTVKIGGGTYSAENFFLNK